MQIMKKKTNPIKELHITKHTGNCNPTENVPRTGKVYLENVI